MKILLNPDNGAPIRDVNPLGGTTYFTNGEAFEPGTIFQFEDDKTADKLVEIFGFLQEMNAEDAKKFMAMEKLKCPQCDFETRVKTQYEFHIAQHAKEHELSDLGIPVIKGKDQKTTPSNQSAMDTQKAIDAEGGTDGLEGIGLQDDRPIKNVVMS